MKNLFLYTTLILGAASSINAANVSVGIEGNVSNPTVTGGASLGNASYSFLIIDGSGNGIDFLSAMTLTEGSTYGGDNYVASVFASTNSFLGIAAKSPTVSVTYDNAAPAGAAINAGDQFYIMWLEGTAGTASNSDTSYSITAGTKYFYATGATPTEWQVPSGGQTVNAQNAGAFQSGTVIPEPSSALLAMLGALFLLRRKR